MQIAAIKDNEISSLDTNLYTRFCNSKIYESYTSIFIHSLNIDL